MNHVDANDRTTIVNHWLELRRRLIYSLLFFASVFVVLFCFAKHLYYWLALPLLHQLPSGSHLIATGIASTFLVPIKFVFVLSVFICVPVFLYHLWAFITPALYQRERKIFFPLLFVSIGLFYLGVAFAFFIAMPILFHFFTQVAPPPQVKVMPDIYQHLDFTLKILMAFGMAFEVPVVVVMLIRLGIVSHASLAAKRPYIIVAAFIIGMLLTPPDVVSQIMLAIPIWLLYEVGLLVASKN